MIRPADAEGLLSLKTDDPFYTRVLSLFESYGAGYDFAGVWTQDDGGANTSAISRFEDKFSLYLTDRSDLDEVAAFLRFQGAGSVMFDSAFGLNIHSKYAITGGVLEYKSGRYNSEREIYAPDIKPLYELLKSCESEIFIVPEYMSFLSDVTHRRNLGKCEIMGIDDGGVLASSVMTVSQTEFAAIIGAVATHPDHRRKGLSRELVLTLASRITGQGRAAYVFSASEANTRFYQGSGFDAAYEFTELFL